MGRESIKVRASSVSPGGIDLRIDGNAPEVRSAVEDIVAWWEKSSPMAASIVTGEWVDFGVEEGIHLAIEMSLLFQPASGVDLRAITKDLNTVIFGEGYEPKSPFEKQPQAEGRVLGARGLMMG